MNRRERRHAAKAARGRGRPGGALPPALAAALSEATAHHQAGRAAQAEAGYRAVLSAAGEQPDALHQLGLLLAQTNRAQEGIALIERAVVARPRFAEAQFNLGTVLSELGDSAAAAEHYRAALETKPDFTEASFNLGITEIELGRADAAEAAFRTLIERVPDHALALNGLGVALDEQGRTIEAEASFTAAIAADPACADAHVNLGNLLYDQGKSDEAVARYEAADQARPSDAARIKAATVLPVIMGDKVAVTAARARFDAQVSALCDQPLAVADPLAEIGMTGFYLAYHGVNDRDSQRALAQLMAKACPALTFTAPHCAQGGGPVGDRLRIGFVSRHFSNHTIGRLKRGVIAALDRTQFEVLVFRWPQRADAIGDEIARAADRLVELPPTLEGARQAIAAERCDVLYYADIGMEPFTYFLGFARLAPLQCVFWGHPMTTGLANIDRFLSAQDLEIAAGDAHYTESLVRLATPAVCYRRPEAPKKLKSREDFGFGAGAHIYLCPQTLFKFHPDFDPLLKAILEGDGAGELVLIEGKHRHWQELLMARFERTIGKVAERIRFLPRQGYDDFLSLMRAADVILDPAIYGGGNSTLEAVAMGTPVVTLPGDYLRDRISYAWFRKMGVTTGVAADGDAYIAGALELGSDRAARAAAADELTAASDRLFDDDAAVRGLEAFLLDAAGH
jgi:predicted O-linked N-acetylglucosamine transferase (SPINDLY family)